MITLKFPLGRKPTPQEWRAVWRITGVPPNTRCGGGGRWAIKVNEEQYAEILAYLQALALDLGFVYFPPPKFDGWQSWGGGPPPKAATAIEYKTRDGRIFTEGTRADKVPWGRVVAYRRK